MEKLDEYAKIIWDYMLMHQELNKVDAIIALGTNDIRVAERAFEIYKEGFASKIICTGGIAHTNDILNTGWDKSEAEIYKDRLIELGVPLDYILVEDKAQNTGENARNVKKLLEENNLSWNNFIIVGKPWNERRAFATFRKQWPEVNICMSSPQMTYEEYMNSEDVSKDVFLNVLVGDFQRIKLYPSMGFQIEQEIPANVWGAYEHLVNMGYNKHLMKK